MRHPGHLDHHGHSLHVHHCDHGQCHRSHHVHHCDHCDHCHLGNHSHHDCLEPELFRFYRQTLKDILIILIIMAIMVIIVIMIILIIMVIVVIMVTLPGGVWNPSYSGFTSRLSKAFFGPLWWRLQPVCSILMFPCLFPLHVFILLLIFSHSALIWCWIICAHYGFIWEVRLGIVKIGKKAIFCTDGPFQFIFSPTLSGGLN